MNKKVISSVLAGAMAVSTMGVAASAATGNTSEGNVAMSAKAGLLEAVIDATLPTDLETFINPYGAQVSTTATTGVVAGVKYSDGIISPTYSIKNEDTTAGLKVTATAKITGSSTVTIMTKPMLEDRLEKATEKQVFAFLNTTTDAVTSKPVFASTSFVGNDQQIAFSEDGTKKSDIMLIGKTTTDNTGYFYVGGQCTPNPETAWDSKDTITVDLILDLSPSAGAAADLSLDALTLDSTVTPNVNIEKDFDGTKTTYELAASASKTKAKSIGVTAKAFNTNVYVKYNGTFIGANQTAAAGKIGVTLTAGTATAGGKVVVTPAKDAANADVDYAVGDKLEFIVVDSSSNTSTTYVINFI